MKTCTICKQEKNHSEYHKKPSSKDGTQNVCKVCKSDYTKQWYQNNRDKHRASTKVVRDKLRSDNRKRIYDYLLDHPCPCGESDPVALDFDHLRDKEFNISEMVVLSWPKIEAEIAKCQVICANCHRKKTAKEFNWYGCIV